MQRRRRPSRTDRGREGSQAAGSDGLSGATRGWKRKEGFSLEPQREHSDTWISEFSLETIRELISVILSLPVCGTFLWQPEETNTTGKTDLCCGKVGRVEVR